MAEVLALDATTDCVPGELTDHDLLEKLRGGDCEAATLLYRRYAKRLRQLIRAKCSPALARRLDADDIMQSVFQVFFQGALGGCYDVPAGEELWPLLLVIALNKIRSQGTYHRAAKRDVRLDLWLGRRGWSEQSGNGRTAAVSANDCGGNFGTDAPDPTENCRTACRWL